MRIDALNNINHIYKANPSYKTKEAAKAYDSDKLELSQAGRDYQTAKNAVAEAPDVREDLIADIKARLANGTYFVSAEDFADKIVEGYTSEFAF